MNYYIDCLTKKYFCFDGRARRKEFWMFVLFNCIAGFLVGLVASILVGITGVAAFGLLGSVYQLGVLLPCLGLTARRLHDIGKSGWWMLIALIPLVGPIVLLVFVCLDSQPGENVYGANPKGA